MIELTKGRRRNKFEPKGSEFVLVGYSSQTKTYRLWERGIRTVINKRDVRFFEEQEVVISNDQYDSKVEQLFQVY